MSRHPTIKRPARPPDSCTVAQIRRAVRKVTQRTQAATARVKDQINKTKAFACSSPGRRT